MRTLFCLATALILAPAITEANPVTYVVPIAIATDREGYTARWFSSLSFFNPSESVATLTLLNSMPLPPEERCNGCATEWIIPPHTAIRPVFPTGAAVFESTVPLAIQHQMLAINPNRHSWQVVPTLDAVIPEGSIVSFPGVHPLERINLFVGNPNEYSIVAEVWVYGAPDPVRKVIEVPAHQTAFVSLNEFRCAFSRGCILTGFQAPSFTIGFQADGATTALVSVAESGDAYAVSPHVKRITE